MDCFKCGHTNDEQAMFCGKCGQNLRVPASAGELVRGALEPAAARADLPGAKPENAAPAPEVRGNRPAISNYLPLTILTIMCCCQPLGIVALLHSVKVNQYLEKGEYDKALDASRKTRMFCLIGIIGGFIIISLYLTFFVFAEMLNV